MLLGGEEAVQAPKIATMAEAIAVALIVDFISYSLKKQYFQLGIEPDSHVAILQHSEALTAMTCEN